ncbi:hypothetical protein LCGC14_2397820, partial [marine sediment metagenome]
MTSGSNQGKIGVGADNTKAGASTSSVAFDDVVVTDSLGNTIFEDYFDYQPEWSIDFDTLNVNDGPLEVRAEAAWDRGAYSEYSPVVIYSVDNPLRITGVNISRTYITPNQNSQNDSVAISYNLSEEANITVKVYDQAGNLARTLLDNVTQSTGSQSVSFFGKDDLANSLLDGNYTIKIDGTDTTGNAAGEQVVGVVQIVNEPVVIPGGLEKVTVTGTSDFGWENIVDGNLENYGQVRWPGGSMTIDLTASHTIYKTITYPDNSGTLRYKIEVSLDNSNWTTVVDKETGDWSGPQIDEFAPIDARYVKIIGIYHGAGTRFKIAELEVYDQNDINVARPDYPTISSIETFNATTSSNIVPYQVSFQYWNEARGGSGTNKYWAYIGNK